MSFSDSEDDSTAAVCGDTNRRPVGIQNNNPVPRAVGRPWWLAIRDTMPSNRSNPHRPPTSARSRRPVDPNNIDETAHPPSNVDRGAPSNTPPPDARNLSFTGSPASATVTRGENNNMLTDPPPDGSSDIFSRSSVPTANNNNPPTPGGGQSLCSSTANLSLNAATRPPGNVSSATSPRSSAPAAAAPPAAAAVPSPLVVSSGQQHVGGSPSQSPPAAAAAVAESDEPSHLPEGFDHALAYVNTVKMRFRENPEVYDKFLVTLTAFQSRQRRIEDVLDEVLVLFADHADLLRRFSDFFPDNIRSQAEARLESAAAAAEERANAPSPLLASPGGASPE
eukprot:scaffold27810_cov61-Skeletonema_dohrnii-CCMP3373.AAC.1